MSFGPTARLYDEVRPSYPAEALAWALDRHAGPVLDLAAGTGRLTSALRAAGRDVICVEPDPSMLAVLIAQMPDAAVALGRAEQIPLSAGVVGAVTVGQAFHWFEPAAALPQIYRVLHHDGVFAAMWNYRDESVDWVAEYARIVGYQAGPGPVAWSWGNVDPWFTTPESQSFPHQVRATPAALLNLLRSRSNYRVADEREQARLEAQVVDLTTVHPQIAGQTSIVVPYKTWVFRMLSYR